LKAIKERLSSKGKLKLSCYLSELEDLIFVSRPRILAVDALLIIMGEAAFKFSGLIHLMGMKNELTGALRNSAIYAAKILLRCLTKSLYTLTF